MVFLVNLTFGKIFENHDMKLGWFFWQISSTCVGGSSKMELGWFSNSCLTGAISAKIIEMKLDCTHN